MKGKGTAPVLEETVDEPRELADEELRGVAGGVENDGQLISQMGNDDQVTPSGVIPPPLTINPF